MIKDGTGGGNTITGLNFERESNIIELFKGIPGCDVRQMGDRNYHQIYYANKLAAKCYKAHAFYTYFLEKENGIDWRQHISSKLLPDSALLIIVRETLFIIEVKYQQVAGSVDEKLQTCDFKRKQYLKLVSHLGIKVEYVYVLNDFFKQKRYADVLAYIHSVNCHYKFNQLPLSWLGLPGVSATSAEDA